MSYHPLPGQPPAAPPGPSMQRKADAVGVVPQPGVAPSEPFESTERKQLAAINITPLVDVLLILLVVVLLAMPMFVKRLPVDLPQTDLAGAPVVSKSLSVSIAANGDLMLSSSPASMADVLRQVTPATSVELSADKDVRYEQIAKTIAELQKKSPRDIALVTR